VLHRVLVPSLAPIGAAGTRSAPRRVTGSASRQPTHAARALARANAELAPILAMRAASIHTLDARFESRS
jgi:hypothetical protein